MANPLTTIVEALPRPDGYAIEDRVLADFPLTEEDFIAHDRRTCNCELTYVHKKRHAALGVGIEIKLCCLAKKVEEIAGLPPGTFFWTMDFQPSWEWDCEQNNEVHRRLPDGSRITEYVRQGPPPAWLLKRFKEKGVHVHNLPEELR
jgi:hypothetical protein